MRRYQVGAASLRRNPGESFGRFPVGRESSVPGPPGSCCTAVSGSTCTGGFQMGRSRSRSPRRERRRSRSTSRERERRRRERSRSRERDRRRSRSRSPHRRRSRSPRRHRSTSPSPSRLKERRDEEKKETKETKSKERQITEEDLEGKTEEEIEMMKLMGFASFDSTKGKKVDGSVNAYAINVSQKRKYRQYMNRKGGFNRPLDFIA
ncbi:U4/U6.U5 small nuclear ribonucleoprotein 27 kDa protein [Dama dama]|nr:U4/U6.U5 small nuclear ribonucleoprotein 27 kDa protein [Dama dama]